MTTTLTAAPELSLTIVGTRWHDGCNTYCRARILIDGKLVHHTEMEYGYGEHYIDIAKMWLISNGAGEFFEEMQSRGIRHACEDNRINFQAIGIDVARKRDL